MRSKSRKLVSSSGSPSVGPNRVGPTNPAVLVLTPSMLFWRNVVSSTYTPGARYSGITPPPGCCGGHVRSPWVRRLAAGGLSWRRLHEQVRRTSPVGDAIGLQLELGAVPERVG